MYSASPALAITATVPDMHPLYADLKNVEGNLRVELRKGITAAGKPVADRVKANASWSSRIPAAVKVKTSFSTKSAGVSVVVNGKKAPEARPLENNGAGGTFRHPVYGDTGTWVAQDAHPFFWSAPTSEDTQITNAVIAVMQAVERKAGFR